MSWEIKIAKRVSKQVKRIPKKDAKRLSFILDELTKNPYQGDIEKIKGEENIWRRRIGSYRVLYEVFPNRKLISVFDIRRRRSRLTPYNHPLGGSYTGLIYWVCPVIQPRLGIRPVIQLPECLRITKPRIAPLKGDYTGRSNWKLIYWVCPIFVAKGDGRG